MPKNESYTAVLFNADFFVADRIPRELFQKSFYFFHCFTANPQRLGHRERMHRGFSGSVKMLYVYSRLKQFRHEIET